MLYVIVMVCSVCVLWRVWCKKSLEPPELSGRWPVVGHAYMLMGGGAKMAQSLAKIGEECNEKGGLVTLHLGFKKLYAITDPEDCLTVMNTCLNKSLFTNFGKQFLGNGLVTSDVHNWQRARKLLNPVFNQRILDGFITIFNSQAEDLVDKFASEVGRIFDHEYILRIKSFDTICETSFDVQCSEDSDLSNQYLTALLAAIVKLSERMQNFWLHSNFIYNMSRLKKEQDEVKNQLVVLAKTMIQKKTLERQNSKNKILKTGKSEKFLDLIMDVAEETGCFTDEEIREHIDTFIIAGHETNAATVSFALTLLGSYPDVQEKLYAEILDICGPHASIDKNHLSKLVYTEAVLKETLRMYPIGYVLPRVIDKDVQLKKYTLKADHDCLVLIQGTHRHGAWGEDAEQFRPERWLVRGSTPDSKYYGGFGLGRRSCIGSVYAMMSMKVLMAHVIRKYRITSDVSKMAISLNIMLRPESGHFISLEKRQD